MTDYSKPWLSHLEQLQQLKDRGLTVTDDQRGLAHLQRIGYYRLSGYWFTFRQRSGACTPLNKHGKPLLKKGKTDHLALDTFKHGTTFQQAVDLYVFDKRLRLLALDGLERIEVALRVDIAHTLGRLDPYVYLNPALLHDEFAYKIDQKTGVTRLHKWQESHARLINRSRETFIEHHKKKYGLPLPIWIASEVWDFGTLSHLFGGMREEEQDAISVRYGISNGRVFASWLRSLNYLRNVCAHHSRLWNRNMTDQPRKPGNNEATLFFQGWQDSHVQARPFLLLCIVQYLLMTINPTSTWWARLSGLLGSFPDLREASLDLKGMGIIEGWEQWEWEARQ
ncbi:Abi family protein [Vreelandella titanicae]|uniref:Abortive infection bacteriophage resistance-related protein n=1 Tax=Vreelandella titanicae BH1 TaxID=1204738 RepID=L9UEN4_9GAMM|nr:MULTISPECIES: Abi family protein [Halomonas]ELY22683.1 Abortive infection bacteriophage resistance-related protein [Halomonas titanicae BH1]MCE7521295.1 Abi family protein [Halomonas titanicae]CEP34033.1 Abortive infection bacteriophage resistance-related protein [Halomonas sp. R57-5]|tara:strand:+ start:7735 stop:8748 length:1014 start_codon:yes stop_codon:yes gene_type:complete